MIIERAEQTYIQSRFPLGEQVEIEYRAGGPDRHYRTVTGDRALARHVHWGWSIGSADWESALQWELMSFE